MANGDGGVQGTLPSLSELQTLLATLQQINQQLGQIAKVLSGVSVGANS